MAQFQNDDLEYVDDYMNGYLEENQLHNGDDSEFEDEWDMNQSKTDTSALEARNGKDIQGIPWERMNFTRDDYRERRLTQYKNYQSLLPSRGDIEKECKQVERGSTFYDFQFNTRLVKSTIVHFQI